MSFPIRPPRKTQIAGLAIFAGGLALLISATFSVARAEAGKPFSGGIYRLSRHPMYLCLILVCTAVSVAAESWLFSAITLITIFLRRFRRSAIASKNTAKRAFCDGTLSKKHKELIAAAQLAVARVLLVGVPLLLAAVPGIPCYVPARQATRMDPMTALRGKVPGIAPSLLK